MKKVTITLAATAATANTTTATATVEAEYGATVVKGTKATLAHHVPEYRDCPAPCNVQDVPVLAGGDTILVSHVDLDTIGGCLALMGIKPEMAPDFWSLAEFVDLNGPHRLPMAEHSQEAKHQLIAFWAWNARNRGPRRDFNLLHDVTEEVLAAGDFLRNMSEEDISEGLQWQEKTTKAAEDCLVAETLKYRVFSTPGVFCNGSYWSEIPRWEHPVAGVARCHKDLQNEVRRLDWEWADVSHLPIKHKAGRIVPAIVSYNRRFGSITLSFESDSGRRDACKIMQSIFGPKAGGHKGIAGSPRGQIMGRKECLKMARWILGRKASRRAVVRLALKMRQGR